MLFRYTRRDNTTATRGMPAAMIINKYVSRTPDDDDDDDDYRGDRRSYRKQRV